MIDLRYHIVSLVAVFLALSLGILLGSSVVRSPLDAQLLEDLNDVRADRDRWRTDVRESAAEMESFRRRLQNEIAPFAVGQRLEGVRFVMVIDGPEVEFRDHVLDALVAAGAEPSGTLTFTERMSLPRPEDADELVNVVTGVVPTFEPSDAPEVDALDLLGTRFGEPTGPALISELVDAGFATLQGEGDGDWPPSGVMIVLLSRSTPEEDTPEPPLGSVALARGAASGAIPVVAMSDTPEGRSAVSLLRDEERLANSLATFDAATAEQDRGGIGAVAALVAASEGRGGHFGTGRGRRFVAPPASGQ